jgi:hypothetical protein
MIFLLKAHRPEKYRERYDMRHAGGIGLDHSGEVKGGANHDDCRKALLDAMAGLGLLPGGGPDVAGKDSSEGGDGEGGTEGPLRGGPGEASD